MAEAFKFGTNFTYFDGTITDDFYPKFVVFPICLFCRKIILDWPHYGEDIPESGVVCDTCAAEEEDA